jgi:hypothetical protein
MHPQDIYKSNEMPAVKPHGISNYMAHRLCNIRIRMRDELAVCGYEMKYAKLKRLAKAVVSFFG